MLAVRDLPHVQRGSRQGKLEEVCSVLPLPLACIACIESAALPLQHNKETGDNVGPLIVAKE